MSTGEQTAAAFLPGRLSVPALRRAAARCTACPLHERGTQTVFGEGPADASLALVGESSLLRIPDRDARVAPREQWVDELRMVAAELS